MYQVTKTYGHDLGLSACFRQWRAQSHCRFLHGYALSFKLTFEAKKLNDCNWVIDFGGLKTVKSWLQDTFDHKLVIAEDDPAINTLMALSDPDLPEGQLADIIILPSVGCEAFAKHVYDYVDNWMMMLGHKPRVRLVSVEVCEHEANSAIYGE